MINYVNCLGLNPGNEVRFGNFLSMEETEIVAKALMPYDAEIAFIKGAVEARDPINTDEVEKRREKCIKFLPKLFSLA